MLRRATRDARAALNKCDGLANITALQQLLLLLLLKRFQGESRVGAGLRGAADGETD